MKRAKVVSALPTMNPLKRVAPYLPERACEAWARRTGFQRREPRKITPRLLLRSLCALAFCSRYSFEGIAFVLGMLGGVPVSKQAVAKRFNGSCAAFLREALFAVIGSVARFEQSRATGAFESFRRVLIQDSTSLSLPARLSAVFPGSRNQSRRSQAVAKIQTVYDLLGERFVSFALTAFTRNDQAASHDMLHVAGRGDLVLRDLGYFVLSVFAEFHRRGTFYLTRLRCRTALLDAQNQPFDLLRTLRREGRLDLALSLGKTQKLPVRLVATPLPPAIASRRRRKARQNRDKRCRPSKAHLELLGWEIFVTNVQASVWSGDQVCRVYGLRWRIETIFKSWKSHFHFADVPAGSAHQVEALLYARLLCISVFQTCFGQLNHYHQHAYGRSLSLLRVCRFLGQHQDLILPLTATSDGIQLLKRLLLKHCCYPKRPDRMNHPQALQCLS